MLIISINGSNEIVDKKEEVKKACGGLGVP